MHCPRCGQRQNSDEIRFCTKCGLEIGEVKELLAPELRQTKLQKRSERNKAARQGILMMFLGFAVIMILSGLQDFVAVPKILFTLSVLIFIIGGALRMSLPSLFVRNNLKRQADSFDNDLETNELKGAQFPANSLPEAEYHPPLNFGAKNFETNELVAPSSVTDNTTKLLKNQLEQE